MEFKLVITMDQKDCKTCKVNNNDVVYGKVINFGCRMQAIGKARSKEFLLVNCPFNSEEKD